MKEFRFRAEVVVVCVATLHLLAACSGGRQPATIAPRERLLFSFERKTMLPMVGGSAPRTLVVKHATHGNHCLRVAFSSGRDAVILDTGAFPMDWRGWQTLKVDVYREGAPTTLHLRITDSHSRRGWVWNMRILTGANTLEYHIPSLEDKVDLSAITEVMWCAEQPSGQVYLDNIRLSR